MSEHLLECPFCGQRVDPNQKGVYRKVTGWVQVRAGGGGNAVRLPSPPQAFAHRFCVDRAARGGATQPDLFG